MYYLQVVLAGLEVAVLEREVHLQSQSRISQASFIYTYTYTYTYTYIYIYNDSALLITLP
jgi:hypothetical protein